jgi:ATP-binding cassette subfamily C protein
MKVSIKHKLLWRAFVDFLLFNPKKQSLALLLMIIQGVTGSVGILLILPLLGTLGISTGTTVETFSNSAQKVFEIFSIPINLFTILVSYIVIVTLLASLRYTLTVLSSQLQQSYISQLRTHLHRQLLNCQWQFILNNKMSDFIHTLSTQVQGVGHGAHLMLSLTSQIILTLVMLIFATLLSWQMTLIALTMSLITFFILLPLNKKLHSSGEKELINFKTIFQLLSEQLNNLKMIKSFTSEDFHAQKIEAVSTSVEQQQLQLTRINAMTQWLYLVTSVCVLSIFFYIGLQLLSIPLDTILLLFVVLARLLPQITSIQKSYQQLTHKTPLFSDIAKSRIAFNDAQECISPSHSLATFNNEISLKNISFRYKNKNHPVFDNLNLIIKKNETWALTGPSGVGKTTLADIISGLLAPSQGEILIDGQIINKTNRQAWRRKIAYVTQEVYLFHDTIRANLIWVTQDCSDDELWQVLNLVAAKEFVEKLPLGLDTIIGDRGIRLSGGERQRLALARALLAKPQLLVLDEATSALDSKNENKIQQALHQLKGKVTLLIIAHSKATIEHADHQLNLFPKKVPSSEEEKINKSKLKHNDESINATIDCGATKDNSAVTAVII